MSAPSWRSDPSITFVLVGYSSWTLGHLDAVLPPGSVLILEEPDVIASRDVLAGASAHRCFGRLEPAPIHDEQNARTRSSEYVRPPNARAVIAAVDYGVVWAAQLAESWALVGAGAEAARSFRDKARLREAADAGGIRQPSWRIATELSQVVEFALAHPGGVVIKPSNLQASVGVRLVDDVADLRSAWEETLRAGEPRYRARSATPPRFLVETRLRGSEVSVETFVRAGVPIFTNVTRKVVQDGPYPVELGHVVPAADLRSGTSERLEQSVAQLVAATGIQTAVLHSEWMLDGAETPFLIECAARIPGDGIDQLISLAYGFDFVNTWVSLMLGDEFAPIPASTGSAVVKYFRTAATSEQVERLDAALSSRVFEFGVKPLDDGEGGIRDSSDRNGYVITVAATATAAIESAETATREILTALGHHE